MAKNSIGQLKSFLHGERSAVETYKQAIEKIYDEPHIRAQLEICMRSHQKRAGILENELRLLGEKPPSGSGVWGSFAKLVEGGAKLFGKKVALRALEEGEDHGRNDYERDLDKLDARTRNLIEREILPEQLRTHDLLSALQGQV